LPAPQSPLLGLLRGSFLPRRGASLGESIGKGHNAAWMLFMDWNLEKLDPSPMAPARDSGRK